MAVRHLYGVSLSLSHQQQNQTTQAKSLFSIFSSVCHIKMKISCEICELKQSRRQEWEGEDSSELQNTLKCLWTAKCPCRKNTALGLQSNRMMWKEKNHKMWWAGLSVGTFGCRGSLQCSEFPWERFSHSFNISCGLCDE